jgi:hypothetical protein
VRAVLAPALAVLLQAAPAVMITTIDKGLNSAVEEAKTVTARTEAEWMKVWRAHDIDRPVPKVDFTRDMVVGVFMGTRTSSGYSVEIVGTRADGRALVVEYRETVPAKGMMTAQFLTSPYHLASVPRVDGDVKFESAAK